MAEVAPAGGGGVNRTFLLIVGGLAALLVIGLLAVGALFLLPSLLSPKPPVAQVTLTPTRVAIATAVPTATLTPEATATLVVAANATTPTAVATSPSTTGAGTTAPAATVTSETKGGVAEATATPTASGSLPQGGLGDNLFLLGGGGLALVVVLFVARRARAVS